MISESDPSMLLTPLISESEGEFDRDPLHPVM